MRAQDDEPKKPNSHEISDMFAKGISVASSLFAGGTAATIMSMRDPGEVLLLSIVIFVVWCALRNGIQHLIAFVYGKRPVTEATYIEFLNFITLTFVFFIFQIAGIVVKKMWMEGELNGQETVTVVICILLIGFSFYKRSVTRFEL